MVSVCNNDWFQKEPTLNSLHDAWILQLSSREAKRDEQELDEISCSVRHSGYSIPHEPWSLASWKLEFENINSFKDDQLQYFARYNNKLLFSMNRNESTDIPIESASDKAKFNRSVLELNQLQSSTEISNTAKSPFFLMDKPSDKLQKLEKTDS
jgi:hypothetical protein